MFAKMKDVAFPCDRDGPGRGRKWPLFERRRIVAKQYLVNFGRPETRNLDRTLLENGELIVTG
jgi:hypothetical protein